MKILYPSNKTFSLPIISASIPDGMPIAVWVIFMVAYTNGIELCVTPKSEDLIRTKEKLYAPRPKIPVKKRV